ncbi:MAG: FeoA domain-containing protein [Treponema sp.]|nr:FeoA domain-containing protein [Treponema sp.]
MNLTQIPTGATFKVVNVHLDKEIGKRLADMGFIDGNIGTVVREGLLHGPLQVQIIGYNVLIRHTEAAGIEVEIVENSAHPAQTRTKPALTARSKH